MAAFDIIAGLILLFYGRKVFWLFVGILGFQIGLQLATETLYIPGSLGMILAIVIGIIAALLAIFLKKVAIGLAGLLAGVSLATTLMAILPVKFGEFSWIVLLIGAVLGIVVLMALFDWALIVLSAVFGAGMILEASASPNTGATLIFILLVIAGISIQAKILKKES